MREAVIFSEKVNGVETFYRKLTKIVDEMLVP